jgi:hypothetical protein
MRLDGDWALLAPPPHIGSALGDLQRTRPERSRRVRVAVEISEIRRAAA